MSDTRHTRSNSAGRLLLMLLGAGMGMFPAAGFADSQALMDRMLDTYINVTPGQKLDTQRRGGITFGSVSVRSRVVRPNFISVQPPSFRGGCQGFDLIGGSFSFINGEQLQQFLRSVASNALNYAFTLALEGVCPTCMQKMEKLRDWSDAINGKLMDSCHFATTMIDKTNLDDWHKEQFERAKNGETLAGVVGDAFQAFDDFISPLVSDNRVGVQTSQNTVIAALQRSNMQSWFGILGDNELLEFAMSVTGTLIKRPTDGAGTGCVNDKNDPDYCIELLPDLIEVEHLINGSNAGPLRIYRCRDWPECLNVTPAVEVNNWPGLKSRINQIMFGNGSQPGLVQKYIGGVGNYTALENSFMEGSPLPVLSVLERVSKEGGAGSAISAGELMVDIIAVQAARDLMMEIVLNVQKTFNGNTKAIEMSGQMQQRIASKLQSFATRVSYEDKQGEAMARILNLVHTIEKENLSKKSPANISASTAPAAKK